MQYLATQHENLRGSGKYLRGSGNYLKIVGNSGKIVGYIYIYIYHDSRPQDLNQICYVNLQSWDILRTEYSFCMKNPRS
jgi:hypothetical protein